MSDTTAFDFLALKDQEALSLLKEYGIALSLEEAREIQQQLGRPLSLSESILWGIQGSEHCSYKSSRNHLATLNTKGPHVVIGAKEDAGVIRVAQDDQGAHYCIAISHESHNHPSQIVPFEGAATGIGGNVRDVSCMGATVIANADSLRFGLIDSAQTKWIHDGVVSGIASYGNAIGVPNVAGDVAYHPSYQDNALVTAVTIGAVKESDIIHSYAPKNAHGYVLILVGKATDNSGFGGASFASFDLDQDDAQANRGAVQEPNAFLGQVLLKANADLCAQICKDQLQDQVGFKDLGAGGIACASVELAEGGGYGATLHLDHVHVAMEQLNPSVVLCSETQERYMWVVPKTLKQRVLDHYNRTYDLPAISKGACAVEVGHITDDGQYQVHYQGACLIDAPAKLITKGLVYDRPFTSVPKPKKQQAPKLYTDLAQLLYTLLADPSVASDKCIAEQYDKQVGGRVIIERMRADAGLLAPFNDARFPDNIAKTGVALACAHKPHYNAIDPYWGTALAVVESMLKVVSVGAKPLALSDCLCFGNPEDPQQMAAFVAAVKGLKDASNQLHLIDYPKASIPIVAGNVSLYNQSKTSAVVPSAMMACVGNMQDVDNKLLPAVDETELMLYMVGARSGRLAGSLFHQYAGRDDGGILNIDYQDINQQMRFMDQMTTERMLKACKIIESGGLALALIKMALLGSCGMVLEDPFDDFEPWLDETPGFVLALDKKNQDEVVARAKAMQIDIRYCGKTAKDPSIIFPFAHIDLSHARQVWRQGLRQKIAH